MVKISTLAAIFSGSSIGLSCMLYIWQNQQKRFANQAAFVQRALAYVKEQPGVMQIIGSKYHIGQASFKDGFTNIGRRYAQIKIPIMGDNDTAAMFLHAKKRHDNDRFNLHKIEMTFNSIPGKRLVLLDQPEISDDDFDFGIKPTASKVQQEVVKPPPKNPNIDYYEKLKEQARKNMEAKELAKQKKEEERMKKKKGIVEADKT